MTTMMMKVTTKITKQKSGDNLLFYFDFVRYLPTF